MSIADFALAKLKGTHVPRATSSGRVLGTAHYMAPEPIDVAAERRRSMRADLTVMAVVVVAAFVNGAYFEWRPEGFRLGYQAGHRCWEAELTPRSPTRKK